MRALKDLPSLEKMEYEQDIYGITYGNISYIIYYTHTRLTALFRDYPGEPVPER